MIAHTGFASDTNMAQFVEYDDKLTNERESERNKQTWLRYERYATSTEYIHGRGIFNRIWKWEGGINRDGGSRLALEFVAGVFCEQSLSVQCRSAEHQSAIANRRRRVVVNASATTF